MTLIINLISNSNKISYLTIKMIRLRGRTYELRE